MKSVDHINVDVDDLETCYPFYRDKLKLTELRSPESFQGDHAMFEAGETIVTLVETGRADRWRDRQLAHPLDKSHLAFRAEPSAYERLIETFDDQFPNQGPYDWGEFEGYYFLDPDGNLLEVVTDIRQSTRRDQPLLTHDDVTD